MDGMSANVAMNMQEGMRNMADQAGIGLGNLMKEVAQASKEALGYQIKSGPALAKAVAYTQSMGLNFGDVAKAGKNMVMNYKDSIKAEMQLSSMLGEQVDLAEVRAKFAAGDTTGALESLKAQGLNPEDMDMFQQQALQDALGGMDLNSLQKAAQNTGKDASLSAGNAAGGNKDFLSRTQSAEATMNAKQASISAQTAIVDAELSKKIEDAYLAGPGYAEYKKKQSEAAVAAEQLATAMRKAWLETDEYKKSLSDSMKLNFVDGIKEKLLEGASALAGGLITTGISKIPFGKMFGKKKKGGAPGEAAAPDASGGGGGIADVAVSGAAAGADALVPGSGAIVESVAENIQKSEEVFEKVESVKDKFKSFANTTKSIIKEIGGIFKTFAKTVGDVAKEIIKIVQDVGNQLITSITSILQKILTSVQTIGTQLADTLGNVLGKIVDNVGKILNKGVDIVTQIGNKLASGVMEMFNTVVGGLTKASGELPTLLGNLGKAVGAFFQGLGTGLAAFGNAMAAPSPAFGVPVGLIVVGIAMGLAKALDIASPGIKALTPLLIGLADVIGKTFVDAMKAAGPVITSIFNGIATVIKSVGDAIIGIINSITDSIARLSGLDAGQMLAVAGGIAAMAGAIIIYGAASGIGGVLGAIGEFFGGSPVDNFKEFESLNAGTLYAIADAITYLGKAVAGFAISPSIGESIAAMGKGFAEMADYVDDGEITTMGLFAYGIQNMVNPLERMHNIISTVSSLGPTITGLGASIGAFKAVDFSGFTSLFSYVNDGKADSIREFSSAMSELGSQMESIATISAGIDTTALAFINLASALDRLGEVNIKAVNDLPWLRMTAFAGAGGRITLAQSANNSFNIAQDSAKNIEKLVTDTKAHLQVSKNLQALIAVLADNGESATQVIIDGKNIATMIKRRNDNIKGRNIVEE
jgi:phage-related protein